MKNNLWVILLISALSGFNISCGDDDKESCESDTGDCPTRTCPDAGTTAPPSGTENDIGAICAYDNDCSDHCISGLSHMAPYCTRNCDKVACPQGYSCLSTGQLGLVCVMGPCQSATDCPSTYSCYAEDDIETPVCRPNERSCNNDVDCPAATACVQGMCKLLCEDDDHCKQGYHCHWGNACLLCTSNAHCADGFSCENGSCNQACINDDDCRSGYQCEDRACVAIQGGGSGILGDTRADAGCEDNDDCEAFCYNEYCTETCEPEVEPTSCPEGYSCHSSHMFCQRD